MSRGVKVGLLMVAIFAGAELLTLAAMVVLAPESRSIAALVGVACASLVCMAGIPLLDRVLS